jgi:hypothetical protein
MSTTTVVFAAPWTGSAATTTTVSSVVATHQAITVLWRDVEAALLATTANTGDGLPSPGGNNGATDVPSAATASTSGTAGLSQGARIGIGVGAAAGGILLFGTALAFLLRGRRKRKELPAPSDNENDNDTRYKLDTSGTIWKRWVKHAWRAEVSNESVKAELAGNESPPVREASEQGDHEKRAGRDSNNGEARTDPVELPA